MDTTRGSKRALAGASTTRQPTLTAAAGASRIEEELVRLVRDRTDERGAFPGDTAERSLCGAP